MTACEFLLLNGAKVDRKDDEGRTPLHHAAVHGMTGSVPIWFIIVIIVDQCAATQECHAAHTGHPNPL